MKNTGLLLSLILTVGPIAHPTQAQEHQGGTGSQLTQRCRLYFEFLGRTGAGREETFGRDPFGMGYCAGLIRGTLAVAQALMPNRVCIPTNATGSQLVWAVLQHAETEPAVGLEQDTELVLRALENTFRCP